MTLKKLKFIGITLFLALSSFTATNTFAQSQVANSGTEIYVASGRNSIKLTPHGSLYGNTPKTAFDESGSVYSALQELDPSIRPKSGDIIIGQSGSENAPLGDGLAMFVGLCIIFGIRKMNIINELIKKTYLINYK